MPHLEIYRQQHHAMIGLVTDVLGQLNGPAVQANARLIHSLLRRLAGKLSAHLTTEDQSLYPALLQHSDEAVRTMARRFIDEMGSLHGDFQRFLDRWPEPEALRNDSSGFIRDAREHLDSLAKRVVKEETQLYPLAR